MEEYESILNTIKHMLGPGASDTHFDPDIIIHINTALSTLTELGVGPAEGFVITGDTETWASFITLNPAQFAMIKSYVYLRVRKLFDPPQSSALLTAINEQIAELEWRITVWASYTRSLTTT